MKRSPLLRSFVLSLALLASFPSFAAVKKEFNICWTIYAGWMPWGTISNEKIIDKWPAGTVSRSISYSSMTTSNRLTSYTRRPVRRLHHDQYGCPDYSCAGGVDTTALITGSYSDGNDGVVLKGADKKLSDLKVDAGLPPELSVSHYLLVRGLEKAGLQERDVKVVNTF
ncbi:ABC transporter periplasmic binding protein, urea carboxylase region [Raoultella terrigena]|uniref:ABC transporter periplasmic binding protein, urea carboxylase region n=1 Tax=Raoultella terrigena TaxID=577 RepID=A0A3P8JVK5_RAOTE|nr:ABC transporter periplasmic binding protein, urea carboxylase region [Raoultella terrigena]